ncbi:MAG: hypothetical protein OJF51_000404 [Nitrospira sp.]|jgi:hypothetical protein|nr:MAG: hypothetical protein OJF51_000404 [Nitrospira sp.]
MGHARDVAHEQKTPSILLDPVVKILTVVFRLDMFDRHKRWVWKFWARDKPEDRWQIPRRTEKEESGDPHVRQKGAPNRPHLTKPCLGKWGGRGAISLHRCL